MNTIIDKLRGCVSNFIYSGTKNPPKPLFICATLISSSPVYDDVCHLARFGKNHLRLVRNSTTEYLVDQVKYSIDNFHFRNHIDPFCHANYNPKNLRELDSVNTVTGVNICPKNLKLSVLINQKIFKTVYLNFLKTVYQNF